jgi:tetratricopeptide (TPR) repeat protein
VDLRSRLIPAHQGLGNLLVWRGQSERAVAELQAAVDQAEALIPVEPANAQWKSLAAGARLDLARVLLSLGRRDAAAQQTETACALVSAIRTPDILAARQTGCLMLRARIALQSGASAEAAALAQRALASAQNLRSADPVKDSYTRASIYRVLGDARRSAGDSPGAATAWAQALAMLPSGVTELPTEMDEHVALLERVGRADDSRALARRLQAIGYRRLS